MLEPSTALPGAPSSVMIPSCTVTVNRCRVGEEPVRDHVLGDSRRISSSGPAEDAQHVGPADHADQAAAGIDDGEPLQPQRVHQPGCVPDLPRRV